MRLYRRDVQQDVRELGAMLGDVIVEQQSDDAFETVEALRTTAIEHRDGQREDRHSLKEVLDECGTEQRLVVARAFTTYFELINLAEERERIRALREQAQASAPDDGLEEAVEVLAEVDEETAQQVLDDVLIEPTFTAHPTEARRKTVKAKLRDIASLLEALDERLLTDKEVQQLRRDLRAEVSSLWLTPQVRERRPEPLDEAQSVHWYLENVLFDVVGDLYDELEGHVEDELDGVTAPKLFEFRSWAGSDRDGNPYVTPEVTTETLETQRRLALEHYRGELDALSTALSQGGERVEMGDRLAESLTADRDLLPRAAEEAATRYEYEPYRQKLDLMDQRLARVQAATRTLLRSGRTSKLSPRTCGRTTPRRSRRLTSTR